MPKCAVKQCKCHPISTQKKDGVSYFRFPRNEIEREKWRIIIAADRSEKYYKPNDSSVVCSCHFHKSDMYRTKHGLIKIKKWVLPRLEFDKATTRTLLRFLEKTSDTSIDEEESLDEQSISEINCEENEKMKIFTHVRRG